MLHTLIPQKERERLHREYFSRLIIVVIWALAVAVAVGAVAIFPSFARSTAVLSVISDRAVIDAEKNSPGDKAISETKNLLERSNALVKILATEASRATYSDTIRKISDIRRPSRVSQMTMNRSADGSTMSISITGEAASREELLSLRDRLIASFTGAKIDIPIGQLAKPSNLPFNIRFDTKLP